MKHKIEFKKTIKTIKEKQIREIEKQLSESYDFYTTHMFCKEISHGFLTVKDKIYCVVTIYLNNILKWSVVDSFKDKKQNFNTLNKMTDYDVDEIEKKLKEFNN